MSGTRKPISKKEGTKRLILIFLIVIVVPGVWIGFKVAKGLKEMEKEDNFSKRLPSTYRLAHDDSALIGSKYLSFIEVDEIIKNSVRLPISVLRYRKTYWITVFRAPLQGSLPLDSIVHIEKKNADVTLNYTYWDLDTYSYYKVQYGTLGCARPISTTYVTFNGSDYATVLHNDTTIAYSLQADNLSIRYGKDSPKDIYIASNTRYKVNQNIPVDLMFMKRNNVLYTLLMTPVEHDGVITPTLLSEIIKNE